MWMLKQPHFKQINGYNKQLMKIYVQLIENSLQQQVPAIWLSTFNHNYIFNVPSSFSRFVRTHNRRIPKKPILFFTKVEASTVVGLQTFIQDMFFFHKGMDTKLYVPQQIYNYLEHLRNKMGYRMIPFSYSILSSQKNKQKPQSRLGIKQIERIYEIYEKDNPTSILQNLNSHILQNIEASQRNDSSLLINKDGEFENQDVRIKPFEITDGDKKCINYLCHFHKVQGKVLPDKIQQLNIPFIKIKELLEKGSISLEGRTILSSQIKQEDYLGPCLLIFHISSAKSILNISSHPTIQQYLNEPYRNTTCVHIVQGHDTSIVESQQLKSFLCLLNSKQDHNSANSQPVKHLIYNRRLIDGEYRLEKENQNQHIAFIDFIREQKFQCVPDITSNYQNFVRANGSIKKIESMFGSGMTSVRMFGELFCYKRCYELILSPLHNAGYKIGRPLDNPLKRKSYSLVQVPASTHPQTVPSSLPYCNFTHLNPTVSILGTSSTRARMMRNVSCIYMQVCEGEGIILDCGEGSYHQLLDHFGLEKADEILLKTKILFITHFHSDHSLGILQLISQRNKLIERSYNNQGTMEEWREQNKMFLIVPYSLAPWLDTFNKNIEHFTKGCHLLFTQTILNETTEYIFREQHKVESTEKSNNKISQRTVHNIVKKKSKIYNQRIFKDAIENQDDCEADNQRMELLYKPYVMELVKKQKPFQEQILSKFQHYLEEKGISQFLPIHVDHCPQSFAVVVKHKSGIKISYSGDCRPSKQFCKAAKHSTLMIHEATFTDDYHSTAIKNKHCTVSQAIDIALNSQSWKLALTHFSNRNNDTRQILTPKAYKGDKRNYAINHTFVCFDHLRMKMSDLPTIVDDAKRINSIYAHFSDQN